VGASDGQAVTERVDALVVGAGPAGLAAAAALRGRGVRAVALERGAAIGARWRARYDGLRLNTFRAFSHLPGMRLPRAAGRYASRDAFVAYLDDYAAQHSLDVRLGVEAQRIERAASNGWVVDSSGGRFAAPNVVVATGWDGEAKLPRWATGAPFTGPLLHTCQLRDLAEFRDRRVLIAGAGNSGIDVAGLLVHAAHVTVSMRTPPSIFPRDWLGAPLGATVRIGEYLPSWAVDPMGRFIQWQVYGDLSPWGVPRAPEGFMTRFRRAAISPAVDDGFVAALKAGRARVVGEVERLAPGEAVLVDGGRVPADAVICATGYGRGLERLVGHLGVLDERGVPRYAGGAPGDPQHPGLYFAGFEVALSGSIRVSGRHARRIASAVAACG
jgi:putative flavoprotein involved in K+ transport